MPAPPGEHCLSPDARTWKPTASRKTMTFRQLGIRLAATGLHMNEQDPKPVLWSTILFRLAMLLVLLAALAMAFAPKLVSLFNPQRRLTTSGDPADIRLVGVVPDGDDVLFDARGKVVPGVKFDWPGKRTYTWPAGTMLREFVFELGP